MGLFEEKETKLNTSPELMKHPEQQGDLSASAEKIEGRETVPAVPLESEELHKADQQGVEATRDKIEVAAAQAKRGGDAVEPLPHAEALKMLNLILAKEEKIQVDGTMAQKLQDVANNFEIKDISEEGELGVLDKAA